MKQKQWIRITEDTLEFSEGEVYIVDRRENDGLIVINPDNPFAIEWVEDGIYEFLEENPFK